MFHVLFLKYLFTTKISLKKGFFAKLDSEKKEQIEIGTFFSFYFVSFKFFKIFLGYVKSKMRAKKKVRFLHLNKNVL